MLFMVAHVRQGWVSTRFMLWSSLNEAGEWLGSCPLVNTLRSKRSSDCKVPRRKPGTASTLARCNPSSRLRWLPGVPGVLRGERGSWIACDDLSQLPPGPACANAASLPFTRFPRGIPNFIVDYSCCSPPSPLRAEAASLSAWQTSNLAPCLCRYICHARNTSPVLKGTQAFAREEGMGAASISLRLCAYVECSHGMSTIPTT